MILMIYFKTSNLNLTNTHIKLMLNSFQYIQFNTKYFNIVQNKFKIKKKIQIIAKKLTKSLFQGRIIIY